MKIKFPDPYITETIEDVICVGGELTYENLVESYKLGIFPWPHKGYPLLWFCPEQRGVLDFSNFHIGRTLKKWISKNESSVQVKMNTNFSEVVRQCKLQKRKGQKGSWINSDIEKSYSELSQKGKALSVECYRNEELISGIYGVRSEKYFSCESMFFKIDNGSKYAFVKLVEYLKSEGHAWIDLQMITEVSGSFGGKYISKHDFLKRINI